MVTSAFQCALCFLPVYPSIARRFALSLPVELRYHHGYGTRRLYSAAHRWALQAH